MSYICVKKVPFAFKFLLIPHTGTGTFGRVFLVEDNSCNKTDGKKQPLALKIMKICDVIRMDQVEHVNSERKIAVMTRNPFIVQW